MSGSVRRLMVGVAVAAAVVTLAADVKVKTDHDKQADFTLLRTYTWLPTPPFTMNMAPEARDERFEREALDAPIRASADNVLRAKKFTVAEPSAAPDFFIVYYVTVGVGMNAEVLGEHYGYLTGWGSPLMGTTATQSLRVIEHGTLVMDVLRGDRSTAIWRGTATGAVDRTRSGEQRLRALDGAVKKLLAKFPPKR